MDTYKIDIEQYQKEFEEWRCFFNEKISLFMIATGFAAINLEMYFAACIFGLLFLCAHTQSTGKFPKLVKFLRAQKRNQHQDSLLKVIHREDFSLRSAFTKFLPFTMSNLFIASVMGGFWS